MGAAPFVAVVVLVSVLSASCSGGGAAPTTCTPTGTALSITADSIHFDKNCLAAPANEAFTIAFNNTASGTDHDVLISVAFSPGSKVLFDGDIVMGPTSVTYDVPALAPGTYSFECKIHPGTMHGTFVVPAAASSS